MTILYIAELVYSKLGEDGKYHVDSTLSSWSDADYAKQIVDEGLAAMKKSELYRPKFGRVFEIDTSCGIQMSVVE